MTRSKAAGRRDAQLRMWDETPLAGQTLYTVYYRKSWGYGSCRKYLAASGRGFTGNRYRAWKTTSLDEAKRRAANLEGGRVAEFKKGAKTDAE